MPSCLHFFAIFLLFFFVLFCVVVGDFDEEEISMVLFLPDRVLWVRVAISSDEGMLINGIILYHY